MCVYSVTKPFELFQRKAIYNSVLLLLLDITAYFPMHLVIKLN